MCSILFMEKTPLVNCGPRSILLHLQLNQLLYCFHSLQTSFLPHIHLILCPNIDRSNLSYKNDFYEGPAKVESENKASGSTSEFLKSMPSFVEFSKKFIINAEKHQEATNKRLDALEASSELLKGKLHEVLEKTSAREKGKLPGTTERDRKSVV